VGAAVGAAVGVGVAVEAPDDGVADAEADDEALAEGLAAAVEEEGVLSVLSVFPGSAWLTRAATNTVAPTAPTMLRRVHRRSIWRPSSRLPGVGGGEAVTRRVWQPSIRNF
jgi:hypothetical protein